jgi:hypothetical protein
MPYQDASEVGPDDIPDDRIITLSNGNKLHVVRGGRWGHFTIHYDKGQVPETLKGTYTTFEAAMLAITTYLTSKNKEIKDA